LRDGPRGDLEGKVERCSPDTALDREGWSLNSSGTASAERSRKREALLPQAQRLQEAISTHSGCARRVETPSDLWRCQGDQRRAKGKGWALPSFDTTATAMIESIRVLIRGFVGVITWAVYRRALRSLLSGRPWN